MATHDEDVPDRPSRSARRRDALDVLALAKRLSGLPASRLDALQLPDDVRDELAELQRTPSHIAHKRQLAHLAKLMRACGEAPMAGARAALAHDRSASVRDAAALHRVEALREALLGDSGATALTDVLDACPGLDRQRLRALVRQARRERAAARPPRAQRELFRMLRDIAEPGTGDQQAP